MKDRIKYIVVHSGARDYYILAKALLVKNRLKLLITDFALSLKNTNVKRFRIPIPRKLYIHFPFRFFYSKLFKIKSDYYFSKRYLKKLLNSNSENTALLIFSYYAYGILEELKKRNFKILVFQVHPDSLYVKERLEFAKKELSLFRNVSVEKIIDNELESLGLENEINYNFSCVDAIICASYESKKSLRFSGYTGKVFVLPYYSRFTNLLTEDLVNKKLSLFKEASSFKILYIGTLSIRKGIFHLLDKLISNGFGECEIHICSRHRLNIEILEPFLNLNKIKFYFNKTDDEVRDLIVNSHYIILPSFVEGFGLSLIESISLCTPILATKNTCLVDFLDIAEVGLCYDDANEIANAISENYLSDFSKYESLVRNCVILNNELNENRYVNSLNNILDEFEADVFKI
jgi:glycosyltransferase involved in cell wall biosynthesis